MGRPRPSGQPIHVRRVMDQDPDFDAADMDRYVRTGE
jgi:hypothetical protein